MPAAATANAADHATMAGMTQHQPRTADSIMDHAAHTPAPGSVSATDKLMTLARALLSDSAVMRRIEANDSLRAAWSNPAVRQVLGRH